MKAEMFRERLKRLLSESDDEVRRKALENLHEDVMDGEIKVNGEELIVQGLRTEAVAYSRALLWLLAGYTAANDTLRAEALRELENPRSANRGYAISYLLTHYPDEASKLTSQYERDSDPLVLFHVGKSWLSRNPQKAIALWIKAMDSDPPYGLDEALFEWISKYADLGVKAEMERRDREAGGGTQWEVLAGLIGAWNHLEYLDVEGLVSVLGEGYWVECPKCDYHHGVREGHVRENVRCRSCGHIFRLPPKEET